MSSRRKPAHRNESHHNRRPKQGQDRAESNFVRRDGARLILSRGVRRRLTPAGIAQLAAQRNSTFNCWVCGTETRFSPTAPAAVIVVHAPPLRACCFAHPHCSPSKVLTEPPIRAGDDLGAMDLAISVWMRPNGCQPHTILLCRLVQKTHRLDPTPEELADPILAGLVDRGFALLTDMDAPFPTTADLQAKIDGDVLTISGPRHGEAPLLSCPLPPHDGPSWYQPALAEGRLGVVILIGADPDCALDSLDDELQLGICEGRAAAATARLTAQAANNARRPTTTSRPLKGAERPRHENHYLIERPPDDDQRPGRRAA
jgi:hypothetical protein